MVAQGTEAAALDLQAAFEKLLVGVHGNKKLRAAKTHLRGKRLRLAVGAREEGDPLPEDPAAPALGYKTLAVTRLELCLKQARDPLVVFEVADPDAALKVQKLWPEANRGSRNGLGKSPSSRHGRDSRSETASKQYVRRLDRFPQETNPKAVAEIKSICPDRLEVVSKTRLASPLYRFRLFRGQGVLGRNFCLAKLLRV